MHTLGVLRSSFHRFQLSRVKISLLWPADAFLYTVEPDPLEWLNLERALGAPALACFTAGELALRLARLSEADLTAYLVGTLRRMFPRVVTRTVNGTGHTV